MDEEQLRQKAISLLKKHDQERQILIKEISNLKEQISMMNDGIVRTENSLKGLYSQCFATLQSKEESIKNEIDILMQRYRHNQSQYETFEQRIEEQKTYLKSMQSAYSGLCDKFDRYKLQREQYMEAGQLSAAYSEKKKKQEQILSRLQRTLNDYQNQLKEKKVELSEIQKVKQSTLQTIENQNIDIDAMENDIDHYKVELEQLQNSYAQTLEKTDICRTSIVHQKDYILKLANQKLFEVNALKKQQKMLQASIKRTKEAQKAHTEKGNELKSRIEKIQTDARQSLTKLKEQLEVEDQEKDKIIESLKNQLDQMILFNNGLEAKNNSINQSERHSQELRSASKQVWEKRLSLIQQLVSTFNQTEPLLNP